jgi:sugar phosphate isomerase/epimerase
MANASYRDLYFSFFMFTVDLQPDDLEYTKIIVRHIRELSGMGYAGFDLPIAPGNRLNHAAEIDSYKRLREALDREGIDPGFTTNVAATRTFDPSSPDKQRRELGLAYLKSRVDITKALGGEIMAGPIILPYGVFPVTEDNQPIWSDALQEWVKPRYENARPEIEKLGEYAEMQGVKVAIEPVDHWEQPSPNMVREVMEFLEKVKSEQIGLCIDSAHVAMGSSGPAEYAKEVQKLIEKRRLHYVHLSAPDRGAVRDSWIPWETFLSPLLEHYAGPYLVEVFNAIQVFQNPLRLTRRKFWIPSEDQETSQLSAYAIAKEGIEEARRHVPQVQRAA